MASTGKKKQNVFADDEEGQPPNAAFNQAVEAAKNAAPAQTDQPRVEASSTALAAGAPTVVIEDQEPVLPGSQDTRKPEKQTSSKPDRDGPDYTKVTYRVLNEAADAVEDLKLLLKRKYGFKRILLEEIIEVAILGIKQDLDERQSQSILVQRLRELKSPENQ